MAGGSGTRFWPVSRAAKPKQFIDMADSGKTFIRETYERFLIGTASSQLRMLLYQSLA